MQIRPTLAAAALLAVFCQQAPAQVASNPVDDFVIARRTQAPTPRRGCQPMREPRSLPSLSMLADSAAITAAVAEFARQHPLPADSAAFVIYSLTVGEGGGVRSLRPLAYLLPEGQEDALGRLVSAHLRPDQVPPGSMRLRVQPSAAPLFAVEYAERCPAEIRARFEIRQGFGGQAPRQQALRIRARVAPDGRVVAAHVLRSSGSLDVDTWVQGTLQRSTAIPGLIDGVPAAMDVEEEIRVRIN